MKDSTRNQSCRGQAIRGSALIEKTSIQSTRPDAEAGSDGAALEFSAVVQSHRLLIFRFLATSLRDVDLAETLTQECFLKAYRNWSSFRHDASARTWLIRIAINLQKDHWRSRRMQFWRQVHTHSVDLSVACEWLPSNERSPEQLALARDQVVQVWAVVKQMSECCRTLFLLRYVEQMEFSEIARVTGLRQGTVKSILSRTVAKVRMRIGVNEAKIPGTDDADGACGSRG